VLLTGCNPDIPAQPQQEVQEVRQDRYATMAACDREWDDDECERDGGGMYLGPRYFYSHGNNTPYVIDRKGRTRAMPSTYGAYSTYNKGSAAIPKATSGRATVVTRTTVTSYSSPSISRGGFGGGRSSGSFGG
jgi:uncharacterized protein YgiB involved in biofilm formation